MTKRNIAIANFVPREVFNSSWPRFVGFKQRNKDEKPVGLFGLVDGNTRMHCFFKDTTIEEVLGTKFKYKTEVSILSKPVNITYSDNTGLITLAEPRSRDQSVKWLPPYTYIDKDDIEWEVYLVILGDDIHFAGTADREFKMGGYWDMGIWRPSDEEMAKDMYRIEQASINHAINCGYKPMTNITMFEDNPDYGKYKERMNIYRVMGESA